jgi:hypothetical protein
MPPSPPPPGQEGAPLLEAAEPASHSGELLILATAARQLFEGSGSMSTDAVVSLLSALAEVSSRTLQGSGGVGGGGGGGGAGSGAAGGGGGGGASAGRGQLAPLLHRITDVMLNNLGRLQVGYR